MLDDYLCVSQELADWSVLKGLCQVDVIRHALPELDQAAQALAPYDMLCTGKAHRAMDLTAVTERGIAAVTNVLFSSRPAMPRLRIKRSGLIWVVQEPSAHLVLAFDLNDTAMFK